jgi:hypothetical protein
VLVFYKLSGNFCLGNESFRVNRVVFAVKGDDQFIAARGVAELIRIDLERRIAGQDMSPSDLLRQLFTSSLGIYAVVVVNDDVIKIAVALGDDCFHTILLKQIIAERFGDILVDFAWIVDDVASSRDGKGRRDRREAFLFEQCRVT